MFNTFLQTTAPSGLTNATNQWNSILQEFTKPDGIGNILGWSVLVISLMSMVAYAIWHKMSQQSRQPKWWAFIFPLIISFVLIGGVSETNMAFRMGKAIFEWFGSLFGL